MIQPLVSVVIPFYAGADWLKEALVSVMQQTYKNLDIIVIVDGSNENIEFLIEEYKKKVKFIHKKNEGPSSARNLGIRLAKGKYIAFLDSDDYWLPDKLSKQISEMEANKYYWSQHSYEMFWETQDKAKIIDTSLYKGNVFKACFVSFKVQTSCVVVRRDILLQQNIFFPINRRYGQDMVFFRKLASLYPIGYINGIYTRFRIRGNNAGFRASVQLMDRSQTWEDEIISDGKIKDILPISVKFAYKLSYKLNNIVKLIRRIITKNEKLIELFSKMLYLIPYVIFKISFKNLIR